MADAGITSQYHHPTNAVRLLEVKPDEAIPHHAPDSFIPACGPHLARDSRVTLRSLAPWAVGRSCCAIRG